MARDRTARARVRQLLATAGPIADTSGFATGVLKDRIDYRGSSVAFIQLIAAMEQEGEISREIRGKRTYKISATPDTVQAFRPVMSPPDGSATDTVDDVSSKIDIDYDRLAKALVREVWSVLTAVASAAPERTALAPVDATSSADDDYAVRIHAARKALDDLFDDVEAKAQAGTKV
ncbi:hypothetical protein MMAD_55060 (plasmid) [Mycolicibacterium madagascariense]|uniref:Uncharacterized protein n=1 Tax=Mycolicibacterium madagascariense TaxID=212765 RepID=A0A7I7XPN6_9MYCO|nr:hypothetical protein [Mycolicibacterium madagascariense]BBZ31211.1 hypothetical protein MMAD_55060 [Mycolicibacterium madagascariense]